MIYTNSITSKGQITIPKAFRDKLGLDKAGKATLRLNRQGEIVISRPKTVEETLEAIHKILAHPDGKQPLTEKEKLIGDYLVEKYKVKV